MYYLLILFITSAFASMNPSAGWDQDLVRPLLGVMRDINRERIAFKVENISDRFYKQFDGLYITDCDFELQESIRYYTNLTEMVGNVSLGSVLMDQPEMKYWGPQYGYKYLFRYDKTKNLGKLLAKGRKCYNRERCSKTEFQNFETCIKPRNNCKNAHFIYPRILKQSLSRISMGESNGIRFVFGRQQKEFNQGTDHPFSTF